jgi:hypothetical protein
MYRHKRLLIGQDVVIAAAVSGESGHRGVRFHAPEHYVDRI